MLPIVTVQTCHIFLWALLSSFDISKEVTDLLASYMFLVSALSCIQFDWPEVGQIH
jgi:hypothetical protein